MCDVYMYSTVYAPPVVDKGIDGNLFLFVSRSWELEYVRIITGLCMTICCLARCCIQRMTTEGDDDCYEVSNGPTADTGTMERQGLHHSHKTTLPKSLPSITETLFG